MDQDLVQRPDADLVVHRYRHQVQAHRLEDHVHTQVSVLLQEVKEDEADEATPKKVGQDAGQLDCQEGC